MRHIPEEELHAYLDQALSRSQCVEIESHLAGCSSCRATRDGIAALRDRTTALLARLAPPRRVPMVFEALRHEGDLRASIRRRRIRAAAWAASLVLAVGTGWAAAALSRQEPSRQVAQAPLSPPAQQTVAAVETTPALPAQSPDTHAPAKAPPHPARAERSERPTERAEPAQPANRDVADLRAKLALLDVSAPVELAPIEPGADRAAESGGMWRTMSWDGARNETGDELPHIEGLPVIRVQVQATDHGRRPLMVVAQQLASGQVIETIEGPANDVSQFLSRRVDGATALAPGEVGLPTAADQSMAMQVGGDRMLAVTGALPPDSLRAMIRRINAEMRSK
ncbi:MAG TPA: zf-HC2 domain-containing protein [Gemmatimonadales bacterium]|nr:zf-HC2 domain-containing protein [Gemmatimonadales bacterium]